MTNIQVQYYRSINLINKSIKPTHLWLKVLSEKKTRLLIFRQTKSLFLTIKHTAAPAYNGKLRSKNEVASYSCSWEPLINIKKITYLCCPFFTTAGARSCSWACQGSDTLASWLGGGQRVLAMESSTRSLRTKKQHNNFQKVQFREHTCTVRQCSPADMAIVVPATIPMATPLWRGGGMGGAYIAAGIPLGWTTVVWWMTCGGAAYSGCV